jgi:hypothetical protein
VGGALLLHAGALFGIEACHVAAQQPDQKGEGGSAVAWKSTAGMP